MDSTLIELFSIQERRAASTPTEFTRYLYDLINWRNRCIAVLGARGTGKTTLLFQHYLKEYGTPERCLYISADNPLVLRRGIYDTVSEYLKYSGECVIIDEVHKQKGWSVEIKGLYDAYPSVKFILSGSSIAQFMGEKGDLSRRMVVYRLDGLSFREYLNFTHHKTHSPVRIDELIHTHTEFCKDVLTEHPQVLGDFNEYIEHGYYPFWFGHTVSEYYDLLVNILDKVIYEDVPKLQSLHSETIVKMKKLIAQLALSRIPQLNITNLTRDIEVSKDTLYLFFELLDRSNILSIVRTKDAAPRVMKRSKILFRSTNLYYALAENWWRSDPDMGNIREAFFADQMGTVEQIFTSQHVDFTVETAKSSYEIEVGGRNKSRAQLKSLENAYLFKDGIEVGFRETIPLYAAGFLY